MRHALLAVAAALPLLSAAQEPAGQAPPPAPAQAWQPASLSRTSYLFAKLGAVIPQHDDLDGFDNGFAIEGGVGFKVAPNMAIEASIGRFSMSAEQAMYDPTLGDFTMTLDASAVPLTGSLKLFASTGGVELYGLAGLGIYFVSMDGELDSSYYGTYSESDSDTQPGFHVGGGFSAAVSPQVSIGLEAKYVIAKATLFDAEGNLNSLLLTGGLAFRF